MLTDEQQENIEHRLATGYYWGRSADDITNLLAEVARLRQDIEILKKDHKEKLDSIFGMVREIRFRVESFLGRLH